MIIIEFFNCSIVNDLDSHIHVKEPLVNVNLYSLTSLFLSYNSYI